MRKAISYPAPAIRRFPTLALLLSVVAMAALGAWGVTSAFPVYFRTDDVVWLTWAASAGNPLQAFDPGRGLVYGSFRPLQNLVWWGLYRVFGLDSSGYHFALVFLYAASVGFYACWLLQWKGPAFALTALFAWGLLFYYLQYVAFWFSDLTFVLELFWMMAALWAFTRVFSPASPASDNSRSGGGLAMVCFVASHLLALLAKEPAALLLPIGYAAILWDHRGRVPGSLWSRMAILAGVLSAIGLAWIFLKPGLVGREGLSDAMAAGAGVEFVLDRWHFYAAYLSGGAGPLLWAATIWLLATGGKAPDSPCSWAWLATSFTAAFVITLFPAVALLILCALTASLVLVRGQLAFGMVWLLLPVLALMTVDFKIRTYLLEASFGGGIAVAAAFSSLAASSSAALAAFWGRRVSRIPVWLRVGFLCIGVAAVALTAANIPALRTKYAALQTVTQVRNATRELVETLLELPEIRTVVVIEYADRGLEYRRDILPLDDLKKAAIQKPLDGGELQLLLALASAAPEVRSIGAFSEPGEAGTAATAIFAMTSDEVAWLKSRMPSAVAIREIGSPLPVAGLYRIESPLQ